MKVIIRYFGPVREMVGKEEEELEVRDQIDVAEMRREIVRIYPAVAALARSCRVAVNMRYATDDETIPVGGEVALIPPVAGG